jgi:hypothetical protein
LLIKLVTTGAAMVSRLEVEASGKLCARLIALVTVFSPDPNNAATRCLPEVIKDELGSAALEAICDQETVSGAPGAISSILFRKPVSPDLLARPPNMAATQDSKARETVCSGCAVARAASLTLRLSTVFNNEANIEVAIYPLFRSLGETLYPFVVEDAASSAELCFCDPNGINRINGTPGPCCG